MLLIDNNLSTLLKNILVPHFAGTQHVYDINLGTASDTTIWQFAKDNGHTILTKDKDFYFRVSLKGAPPKVIWITRGNCGNRELIRLVKSHIKDIQSFIDSDRHLLVIQ
ncbi:DUF5615 family PIN-like protein [Imperialibacter roseus]|uniref:DUF5615 family PIN-like protein n=1 Tax=Imperialibacter roseus TaxID=1324217 RepID=UPI00374E2A11|tara:strand:- start:108211 stop:108537 length:327 start_codon:yes stop_codon:yes gene_type:complete